LVDAFHVPKLLSQQLLPFGRSDDGLGVLTFGVEQFSVLFVPGRRSARSWQTVREHSVLRVFFVFLLSFAFDLFWFRALVGSGFGQFATESRRSAGAWQTARVLLADGPLFGVISGGFVCFSDGPRRRAGRSVVWVRTVSGSRPDGPRGPCGRSAPPGRTVRQSLSALFFGSIPSSFFRASACASRNRS
jgi:hypothetical protein